MIHRVNPFVDLFKTMEEIDAEQPNGIQSIRMIFRGESNPDPRRYNAPTIDEVGLLIVGGEDESSIQPTNRDIENHFEQKMRDQCLPQFLPRHVL